MNKIKKERKLMCRIKTKRSLINKKLRKQSIKIMYLKIKRNIQEKRSNINKE